MAESSTVAERADVSMIVPAGELQSPAPCEECTHFRSEYSFVFDLDFDACASGHILHGHCSSFVPAAEQ
jgi:hypothetical protein